MISMLTGTIQEKGKGYIEVMTSGGVGYRVNATSAQVLKCSSAQVVTLYTYLKVSDSAMELFGFETREERGFFELLMTVSGVGPKTALHIMSVGSLSEIQNAIGRGDVRYLTAVQGIGKKTAERLVLELKSKVISHKSKVSDDDVDSTAVGEVIDALVSMGYGRDDAKQIVLQLDGQGKMTGELLKMALQQIR